MAFEFGNIVAVGLEELVPSFYGSYENLKKTLQRYKDKPYGPKRVTVGGNGRSLLVNYDTLPQDIQQGILDPRKCDHILERYYEVDADSVRFFSLYQFEDGTYLHQDHQEKYIVNASMLRSILRLRDARISERRRKTAGSVMKGMMQSLVADATSFNATLLSKHRVEHSLPTSLSRFTKTLREFEERVDEWPYNYASLISRKHRNINSRKVDEATLKLLNDLYVDKQAKPNASEVHRDYEAFLAGYVEVVNNKTGELYDPKGYKSLSVETVNKYLNDWTTSIATHAIRSGNRQDYMGKYMPYHSFEPTEYAGSIISIDDRQPPFKALNGKRIWFYNGVDLGSEAFICWVYGETKEGIIMEFYRQLVRNYHEWGVHLPAEVEAEMSLNSAFQDTFLKPGAMFQYVHIEANKARAKRIERYFGNLRYQYEKDREGWLARPNALSERNQQGVEKGKVPRVPYEDIVDGCLSDLEKWNNQPHSIHKDKTRWEVFMSNQNPNLNPTNYVSIIPHIGYTTDTSVNVGIVKLNNSEFLLGVDGQVALGDTLVQLMQRIEGRDILVYWLDDNNGEVLKAYAYVNDRLICELVKKPKYKRARIERGETDADANAVMSSYVATVNAYGKEVRAGIDGATVIRQSTTVAEGGFSIRRLKPRVNYDENRVAEVLPEVEDVQDDWMEYVGASGTSLKDRF
ncbi:hypothetical protein [Sphingobacterium luzhongxinii]|uniref:hypothetical protein n=1 Tax=Sphingobacterium luzhongxinii TaxID=2654181 RepID=UPI0013D9EA2B|nr:hypothetical protein [Sphingobacterium sp. xlx-73]